MLSKPPYTARPTPSRRATLCAFVALVAAHLLAPAHAKSRHDINHQRRCFGNAADPLTAGTLEKKLIAALGTPAKYHATNQPLIRGDLLDVRIMYALARRWDSLSPSVQTRYIQEITFPTGYDQATSPAGLFEVHYTTAGIDAIDPIDTVGFTPAGHTRKGSNGIPDYVDWVGWALDSAWRLEVARLGFPRPIAFQSDRHPSQRYKALICNPGASFYGMTYLAGPAAQASDGFASYIVVRNDWSGWDNGDGLDYGKNPRAAINITCAHELFHAIQFAMVRRVNAERLNDLPVSWLEASAMLMEEIGYDAINDYVQYTDSYFKNPEKGMLSCAGGSFTSQKNILLTKFLYECITPTPSISFIKSIFDNSAQIQTLPFVENLEQASRAHAASWNELLGRFHAESYFTGERRCAGVFLSESNALATWNAAVNTITSNSWTDSIQPFGMSRCRVRLRQSFTSRAYIDIAAKTEGANTSSWTATVILESDVRAATLPLRLTPGSPDHINATMQIGPLDTALVVIVSNAGWRQHLPVSVRYSNTVLQAGQRFLLESVQRSTRPVRYDILGRRIPSQQCASRRSSTAPYTIRFTPGGRPAPLQLPH